MLVPPEKQERAPVENTDPTGGEKPIRTIISFLDISALSIPTPNTCALSNSDSPVDNQGTAKQTLKSL